MARPDLRIILNPISGTLSAREKERLVATLLREAKAAHFTPESITTTHPGQATQLATEAVQAGMSRVVVIGGDGTINEAARAMLHSRTALGIIPVGSGNGLARHLGLSLAPHQAAARTLAGRPVQIDTGRVDQRPFFCTMGFGFEAYVARLFAQQTRRGLLSYARTTYAAYGQYRPQRYQLNGEWHELFSLTVANAGQYGNNAWIAPKANLADGLLDICGLKPFPARALGSLAWRLFNKTLDQSSYLAIRQSRSVTIRGEGPLSLHLDGEPLDLPADSVQVSVVPGSLLVVI